MKDQNISTDPRRLPGRDAQKAPADLGQMAHRHRPADRRGIRRALLLRRPRTGQLCDHAGQDGQYGSACDGDGQSQAHQPGDGGLGNLRLITKVYVDENDHVTQGQTLAQIDPIKLQDAINRAQASLDSARATVQQNEATAAQSKAQLARDEEVSRISGGKVPSKTELDQARADSQRAIAQCRGRQGQCRLGHRRA